MRDFTRRRIRNGGATMIVVALRVVVGALRRERGLHPTSFATGYLMLAAMVFLALYNVRKKLPFLAAGEFDRLAAVASVCRHRQRRGVCIARRASLADRHFGNGFGGCLSGDGRQRCRRAVSDADDSASTGACRRRGDLRTDSGTASAGSAAGWLARARIGHGIRGDDAGRFLHRAVIRLLPSLARIALFPAADDTLRRSLMHEMQNLRRYLSEPESGGLRAAVRARAAEG